jgi:hypothetical protein
MNDDMGLSLLLVGVLLFVSFVAGAYTGDRSAKAEKFSNCIKYHEKLSVVEANVLCDKIVRGVK